jgi:hypothetical protein
MSSYIFVLQEEVDDVDPYVALKVVAKAADKLSEIADEIGVTPLLSFVAGADRNAEDLHDIAENEGWGSDFHAAAGEEWHEPGEALDTVRALLGYIESDPDCLKRPKATMEELRGLEAVLEATLQAGVKFRLELDE